MTETHHHDEQEDILACAARWCKAGRQVALATVIRSWGSSPRPPGSQIAIDANGTFVGSVSGGCIEGEVIQAGLATIADGETRSLHFGVSDEQAWEVGLACGGKIEIRVERIET